jgi:hypothetical protein
MIKYYMLMSREKEGYLPTYTNFARQQKSCDTINPDFESPVVISVINYKFSG